MPLVVELEEGGGVGVLLLQVEVVNFGFLSGVATVLAHVYLQQECTHRQTADSRQQTADSRQQTADSRQQTADIRQKTADSSQQT